MAQAALTRDENDRIRRFEGQRETMAKRTNPDDGENIVAFARSLAKERIMVKPQALEDAELKLHLPAKAKEFLQYLDSGTYYKKGIHEHEGRPAHWCRFDMRACMTMLEIFKPNVTRLRKYLVELRVIQTRIDDEGQLWIGWNLNTAEWITPPKHGGARSGAGHPKIIQDDNDQAIIKPIQDDNKIFQDDNDQARKHFQDDNDQAVRRKVDTGAARAVRTLSKKIKNSDASASGDDATAPFAAPLFSAVAMPVPRTTPGPQRAARPATRASPKGKDLTVAEQEQQDQINAYRAECYRFILATYPKMVQSERGREGKTAAVMWREGITQEEAEGCWKALYLDPFHCRKRVALHLTDVIAAMGEYRNDPEGFLAAKKKLLAREDGVKNHATNNTMPVRTTAPGQAPTGGYAPDDQW